MNTAKRIIHTKLYSKVANEVLQSVEGQLSDGMWENSPAMEKYWRFSDIETAPDGEVLIVISKDRFDNRFVHNGFIDMSDDEIYKWFAGKIKQIMKAELKDCNISNGWSRTNDKFKTNYLSYHETITVSDVYFIYDFLLGRESVRKYSISQYYQIQSAPVSEDQVKAEEARRANIAKLDAEWKAERQILNEGHSRRIKEIEAEFNNAIKLLNAKYTKRISEYA